VIRLIIPGAQEWVLLLLIIALLFGAHKLPEIARSLGRSRVEFEKGKKEAEMELKELERKHRKGEISDSDRRAKLEKIAKDLGIDPTGKSDEELIGEIERMLPRFA